MDKTPADDGADARRILANWLDDYTAGRCDRAQMQASFLEICRGNPEAPWDALALLDQYQRRGRVDAALARSLKSDIAQLVFGVANQTEEPEETDAQEVDNSTDTTGSRWRKLAERNAESRKSESVGDPTVFARDFDPLTRPPQHIRSKERWPSDKVAPGSILRDRYELLSILGRGSTGIVYKALDRHRAHLDHTAQCVALRVLKENYRDYPEALAELERGFHQAQSLSHPNMVGMFDLDRHGDTYFIVMEWLDGELLADILLRLDRHPMPRDRALAIVGGIGAALAHAHRRNVIHGDLKPGKVMITNAGDVKVLDFGFSRRPPVDSPRMEPWIGESGGTGASASLAYASPERVNGERPDFSEDVYSLACIAYELLSGQHPYGGRSGPLARAQGREPQRVRGLSGKQWNALRTALRWSRADRKIDIVDLISGLGCTEVSQRMILPQELLPGADTPRRGGMSRSLIAVVVLLLVGGALAYWRDQLPLPKIDSTALPPRVAESTPPADEAPLAESPGGAAQSEAVIPPPVIEKPASAKPQPQVAAPAPAPTQPQRHVAPPQAKEQEQVNELPQEPVRQQSKEPTKVAKEARPQGAAAGPAIVGFDKDTYVVTESEGTVKLTVRRTGNTRTAATFHWALLSNSAEGGSDFAAIGPETERIAPGASTATLTIPLVSDSIKENTELFLVEISVDDDGSQLGAVSRAAVIIVDDD